MGASQSEPCAMVDMSTSIWNCDRNRRHACEVGWMTTEFNVQFGAIVQGIMHVDDVVVMSYVWCTECMQKHITRMFPSDVGMTPEGDGPTLRFFCCDSH